MTAHDHHNRCIRNIQNFQKIIDQVLPQAGSLALDIGLLNETLMEASDLAAEAPQATEKRDTELEAYDAGVLGGDDDSPTCWWHDYIRSELDAAHEFYQEQVNSIVLSVPEIQVEAFKRELNKVRDKLEQWRRRYRNECTAKARPALQAATGWRSMESAPIDRDILINDVDGHIYKARWDHQIGLWAAECGQPVVYELEPQEWADIPGAAPQVEQPEWPQAVGPADIERTHDTPADWDEGFRKIWIALQVASENYRIMRYHAKELRDLLAAAPAGERVELGALQGELDRTKDALLRARSHMEYLKSQQGDDAEVWFWQGDGSDHPESMANSLTVVIRADDLRRLIAPQQPVSDPDGLSVAEECPECGSATLEWGHTQKGPADVADGRLRLNEVDAVFVLGCTECSETVRAMSADKACQLLPTAAPDKRQIMGLRKDAERYRWLRLKDNFGPDEDGERSAWDDLCDCDADEFDAFIDERRKRQGDE